MPGTTKPSPIALVVCDSIYQEPTGKTALIGLFNEIRASKFPARHGRLCVFVSVTDVRPGTQFKLNLVHAETDHEVARLQGPPPGGLEPTSICDFSFVMENLVFQEPGRHYIQFWGNDHLLLQRPFEVVKIERKEKRKEE